MSVASERDAETAGLVKAYFEYVASAEGQDAAAEAAGSAPISDSLREQITTAIDAIDTLVRAEVLHELPNARAAGSYRAGRPARRFVLASDLGVVIGVDAGDNHVAVTIADLLDRTLVHHRTDIDSTQSASTRRATILEQMEQALAEADVSHESILAICVGVAAPVNRAGISPPHPDGFWERTNPGLAEALADWAPAVEIKNDAQLAAIAEGSVGAAVGCRDYVALLAGEEVDANGPARTEAPACD